MKKALLSTTLASFALGSISCQTIDRLSWGGEPRIDDSRLAFVSEARLDGISGARAEHAREEEERLVAERELASAKGELAVAREELKVAEALVEESKASVEDPGGRTEDELREAEDGLEDARANLAAARARVDQREQRCEQRTAELALARAREDLAAARVELAKALAVAESDREDAGKVDVPAFEQRVRELELACDYAEIDAKAEKQKAELSTDRFQKAIRAVPADFDATLDSRQTEPE